MTSPSLAAIASARLELLGRADAAGEDHLAAVAAHAFDLDAGRGLGHHDHGPEAEPAGRERHRLAVIAAGLGDDAAGAAPLGEPGDGVVGAPDLEGADGLERART